MKEILLTSGATLKIQVAPFVDSKNLYQAVLDEMKSVDINLYTDVSNMLKNIACYAFSSKKIEIALEPCLKRCLYGYDNNAQKIDKDTFEKQEARADYIDVVVAVVEENIAPFMKSLYAQLKTYSGRVTPSVPA